MHVCVFKTACYRFNFSLPATLKPRGSTAVYHPVQKVKSFNMKKIITAMLALTTFVLAASAQESRHTGQQRHHRQHHSMLKGITLSDTQKEQLKLGRESFRQQMAALEKEETITVKEYKTRKAALRKSQKDAIEQLLTPEQKNQLVQEKAGRKAKHEIAAGKRLEKMKARLNLTEDQVTKIKSTREAAKARALAIREDGALTAADKKAQLTSLMKEQRNNFKELLTPEQLAKLEEMKKERMDKKQTK
jgi:Spy/CpxP family protein refolding chaperone